MILMRKQYICVGACLVLPCLLLLMWSRKYDSDLWNNMIYQDRHVVVRILNNVTNPRTLSRKSVISKKHYIQIYRRNLTHWIEDNDVCRHVPRSSRTVLKTPAGNTPIFLHNPKEDIYISQSILKSGGWELDHMKFLCNVLKKDFDTHFIDAGANIGVFSLTAAKCGKKVIAVEPLGTNVRKLCSSVIAGGMINQITILFSALSDVRENVSLGKAVKNIGGTFVVKNVNKNKMKEPGVNKVIKYGGKVMTATLDDLLNLPGFNFKKVFIKIDAEGYENKILKGGLKFFDQVQVRGILMEWLFHKSGKSGTEIYKFFLKRDFVPYFKGTALREQNMSIWPVDVLWIKQNFSL